MRKAIWKWLTLALCAVMLVTSAAAAEEGLHVEPVSEPVAALGPVLLQGTMKWEGETLLLNDTDQGEVIVHIAQETRILNAVTGASMAKTALKDGEAVYIYVSPAMTMSLPPQTTAVLILAKIPADFAVPAYQQVAAVDVVNQSGITVTTLDGTQLTVPASATVTPYLTKNVVTYRDLIPGTEFLAWRSGTTVEKVMLFPYEGLPFTDVEKGSTFYDAISFVTGKGIMQGGKDGSFGVKYALTRAELVCALYAMAGSPAVTQSVPNFSDLQSGGNYLDALTWAVGNQIVTGYSDNTFRPQNSVSRQQMATFLYRWEQHQGGGFEGAWMFLLDYPDRDSIASFAYEGVAWCSMNGILTGRADGTLAPAANVNRGAAAAMIQRYLELEKK